MTHNRLKFMSHPFSINPDDNNKLEVINHCVFRPYGFGAWGYGSQGYMSHALEMPGHGGYHFYGFHG